MWILSPKLPAKVAKTELNKSFRKINELTSFSRCVHLPIIPLTTQNTFDFSCWHATLLGLARLRIISRRAKFSILLSQFFRVFQFFSRALTRPDSRHCSVLFHLRSLALTRFTTLFSVQNYLASFLALDRGRSFAIFFAAFSAVKSCSLSFSLMLCFR